MLVVEGWGEAEGSWARGRTTTRAWGREPVCQAGDVDIRVWQGDITTLDVDAIVNAANRDLRRGSGVCGAIFRAAGPQLDDACAALAPCATGDAVVTPGFDLPARWVIHAVGPIWQGGDHGEAAHLASCYRRSIQRAGEVGATSVAIPAISTGIYGFPPEQAAEIAVATLRAMPAPASGGGPADPSTASVATVVLVAFDATTAARYRNLLPVSPTDD